jgi:hypothetical protein
MTYNFKRFDGKIFFFSLLCKYFFEKNLKFINMTMIFLFYSERGLERQISLLGQAIFFRTLKVSF